MISAEGLFTDLDGPTIERLGLVILALVLKQTGEVVVARRNVGMILAESSFVDLDGQAMERLGLVILALDPKQTGEVVLASCNGRIILAEGLFADVGRSPVARVRLPLAGRELIRKCQVVQRRGSFSVIWAQCRGHQSQCCFVE